MNFEFLKLYEELSTLNEDTYTQLSFDDIVEDDSANTVLDIKTFDDIIKSKIASMPKNIEDNQAKGIQVFFQSVPSARAYTMAGNITWQPKLSTALKLDNIDTSNSWVAYYFFTHYKQSDKKNITIIDNMKKVAEALNITSNYYIISDPKSAGDQWRVHSVYDPRYKNYSCLAGICIPYNQEDTPDKYIIEKFATIVASPSDQIESDNIIKSRFDLAKEFLMDSPDIIWACQKPENFDEIKDETDIKKFYFNVEPLIDYYQSDNTTVVIRDKIAALLDIFGFLVAGCPNSLQYLRNACKQEQLIAEKLGEYVVRNEGATGAKLNNEANSKNYSLLFARGNKAITNASDFKLKIDDSVGIEAKIYSTISKINEVNPESLHNAKFAIVYCVKNGHWYLYEKDQKLNNWFILTHETDLISRNFIEAISEVDKSCPGTTWRIPTDRMKDNNYVPKTRSKTEADWIY